MTLKILFLLSWLALGSYILAGLFQVDPFYFSGSSRTGLRQALMAVRISFVIVWLTLGLTLAFVQLNWESVLIPFFGIAFATLIGCFAALHFYYIFSDANKTSEVHPFLQLSPPDVKLRTAATSKPVTRILFTGGSSTDWSDSKDNEWTEHSQMISNT